MATAIKDALIGSRFLVKGASVYHVEHPDFCADVDGVTDDTAAIPAAIYAAADDGGGTGGAIPRDGGHVREGTVDELTTEDRVWRMRCTAIPDHALNANINFVEGSLSGDLGEYRLDATDRAALNASLDRLRAAGVEIESVEPLRQSLEDLFIDVVEDAST